MKRASKNLSVLLIPMVICSVALGFGGMIGSTDNPIQPVSIAEEVLAEAPVEEPVVEAPEVVEIATPDPVVEEPEVVIEEPEIVIEDPVIEEPVRAQSIQPIADATVDGWIVQFIQSAGVSAYTIDLSFQAIDNTFVNVWHAEDSGRLPPEVFDPGVAVPIVEPTSEPSIIGGNVTYRLDVWALNGGEQTVIKTEGIPVEWIYDVQDIEVVVETAEGNLEPPKITINNVGELDLFIDNIVTSVVGTPGSANNEVDQTIAGGASWEVPASILGTEAATHQVDIYSDDPDEAKVTVLYLIEVPAVASVVVAGADMDVGIGSERFGVTIDYDTLGADFTVTAWLEDADGTAASPVETVVVNGAGTIEIDLKVLFVDAGTDYQYRVTCADVAWDETIAGVSLNHWSDFKKLRNAGSNWEATVKWDPVTVDVGDLSVFVVLRHWDGSVLRDLEENVVVSEELDADELAAGEATLLLAKPDTKTPGATVEGGETWMAEYGAGYYFFTFMAPTAATNPWAARIGCPPEGL
jgi:hypothetical protein